MERRRRKKIENERNPIEVSYESLGMSIKNQGKKKKDKYFLLLLVGHLGFASRVGSFLSFSFLPLTVDSRLGWLTESGVRWHNRRSHWFPRPVRHPGAKQFSNRRIHRLIFFFLLLLLLLFLLRFLSCTQNIFWGKRTGGLSVNSWGCLVIPRLVGLN